MVEEKKEPGAAEEPTKFRVTDKRKFDDGGQRKQEGAEPDQPTGSEKKEAPDQQPGTGPEPETGHDGQPDVDPSMMEATFSNFVLSLGTSAVLHFGEFPDPVTGKKEKNLTMAKHTIDILTMLRDKTSGNLEADEEKLLSDLLYQLRMKYVSLT